VRVEQGDADTTVFPVYTDQLVDALRGRGAPVTYDKIPGASHGGSVLKGGTSATAWVVSRFR
jgi:hypothetical protein